RLGRGDQQQLLGVGWKSLQPPHKALLDPPRQAPRIQHPEPAPQLRERQRPRQLQQCQRVTLRLRHDPVLHPLIPPPSRHPAPQLTPETPEHHRHADPPRPTPAAHRTPHRAPAPPPPALPALPATGAPQTPVPARRSGPATVRRRPGTAAAVPRPPPTASPGRRGRSENDPAPARG